MHYFYTPISQIASNNLMSLLKISSEMFCRVLGVLYISDREFDQDQVLIS